MSGIATYNAKRNFKKTSEPPGKVAAKRSRNLQFVIQKHDASRLHYDFRLEIGGVLVSWAIPKGPSLDPGEKRLAVRTEDHPMAYGGFEGTIPDGEYGGGTVMLWDRGTWIPEGKETAQTQLRKGALKFALEGDRLHGSFALVRMKPRKGEKAENWLLIKHGDAAAKRGSGDAVVRSNTNSVASKRSMDEIAAGIKVWHSNRKNGKDKTAAKPAAAPKLVKAKRKSRPVALVPAKLRGSRKAPLARKLKPQLATLVEDAPEDSGWLSEIKFDGYRMVARIDDGTVTIFSRNGLDWTSKLPHLVASLSKLPVKQAWVDGEVVSLDGEGHSSFSLLKNALSDKQTGGLFYYLFDLMHLDGYDLSQCAQIDRKNLLAQLLAEPPPFIKYSEHYEGVPERVREQACAMHLEGVICKRADAPYQQSRNRNWLKLKCIQREEFVIVGYTAPKGSRSGFGALLMGYYDSTGVLHYAGGVGTGFNQATLKDLHAKLEAIERKIGPRIIVHGEEGPPRGIRWVKPELIAEIQFLDWTGDGVLRHAIFLGLREDKEPMDVVREPPASVKAGHTLAGSAIVTAKSPRSKAKRKKATAPKDVPAIIDKRRAGAEEEVSLSHPDRVLWPDVGLTKADLAEYWEIMADLALPHIVGRALALVRCPDGIEGEQFFQKKASPGFPRQILNLKVAGETVLAIEDAQGLRVLAQMSAIELHPWGSRLDDIERPDRLIFDFDPDPTVGFDRVIEATLMLRQALDGVGLKCFPKTTGGKGLHVVVPIKPELEWPEAKAFCHDVARWMVRSDPKRFTAEMAKKARKGRIFVDYLRNGRGSTAIAPFSPRARAGASFAMPLAWKDVKPTLDPKRYTLSDAKSFRAPAKAAWKGFFDVKQSIGAKARRFFAGK